MPHRVFAALPSQSTTLTPNSNSNSNRSTSQLEPTLTSNRNTNTNHGTSQLEPNIKPYHLLTLTLTAAFPIQSPTACTLLLKYSTLCDDSASDETVALFEGLDEARMRSHPVPSDETVARQLSVSKSVCPV